MSSIILFARSAPLTNLDQAFVMDSARTGTDIKAGVDLPFLLSYSFISMAPVRNARVIYNSIPQGARASTRRVGGFDAAGQGTRFLGRRSSRTTQRQSTSTPSCCSPAWYSSRRSCSASTRTCAARWLRPGKQRLGSVPVTRRCSRADRELKIPFEIGKPCVAHYVPVSLLTMTNRLSGYTIWPC